MNVLLLIKTWILAHPALCGFVFGLIIAGPFYLAIFSLMTVAKRSDEWIEHEYFDVKADKEGFEVMTH